MQCSHLYLVSSAHALTATPLEEQGLVRSASHPGGGGGQRSLRSAFTATNPYNKARKQRDTEKGDSILMHDNAPQETSFIYSFVCITMHARFVFSFI